MGWQAKRDDVVGPAEFDEFDGDMRGVSINNKESRVSVMTSLRLEDIR